MKIKCIDYSLLMHKSRSLFFLHKIVLALKIAILGSTAISQEVKKKEEEVEERRSETL